MNQGQTVGKALDDLVLMLSEVNYHAQVLKSRGLSVQFSVNGYDYGDTITLRIEGEPTNRAGGSV
jgi:hypothetical protein